MFVERNEWEGETWVLLISLEENEELLEALETRIEASEILGLSYSVGDDVTETEAKMLVELVNPLGFSTYDSAFTLVEGHIDLNIVDFDDEALSELLYKCGLARISGDDDEDEEDEDDEFELEDEEDEE